MPTFVEHLKATSTTIKRNVLIALAFVCLKHFLEPISRHLGIPLEAVKINIDDAKSRSVSRLPLEVVEQRPSKVANHIGSIINRLLQLSQVASVEVDPRCVVQPLS